MPRPIWIVSGIAAILLIQACSDGEAASETRSTPTNKVVALSDGTTLVVPPDSLARSLVDWTRKSDSSSEQFSFGDEAFLTGSSRFSKLGIQRATNLGLILRGTPDMILSLPVTEPGETDVVDLKSRRSLALAAFLKNRGILADQIRPLPARAEPTAERDRVPGLAFTVERRSAETSAQESGKALPQDSDAADEPHLSS